MPLLLATDAASASISARVSSVPVGLAGEATSRPAVLRSSGGEAGGRRLEIAVRADRQDRAALKGTQDVAVAGIAGIGQQPFVARVGQAAKARFSARKRHW
jgi:N-acetylglucosamine kinase-like BadF-type ATPase